MKDEEIKKEEKMKDEEIKKEENVKDEDMSKKENIKEEKNIEGDPERTEKKKILDIAKYFAHRYNLPLNEGEDYQENEVYGTYVTQIKRIMKKVPKDGENLWDFIKEDKKARMISINDFILNCFPEWEIYIKKKHLDEMERNSDAYQSFFEDKRLYDTLTVDKILNDKQNELLECINNYYEEGYNDPDNQGYVPIEYRKDDEKVKLKGYGFMIEAIYNIFYSRFKWDLLAEHMTLEANRSDEYNTPPTNEEMIAILSLNDFENYTVEKSDIKKILNKLADM